MTRPKSIVNYDTIVAGDACLLGKLHSRSHSGGHNDHVGRDHGAVTERHMINATITIMVIDGDRR
jgi:hypothetical protein